MDEEREKMSRMIDGDLLIDRMKELHEMVERDYEEAEKINGVEIIREYPQPTNMNDWCGNGVQR